MYQTLARGGMVECSYDCGVLGRRVQCHQVRGSAVLRSDYKDMPLNPPFVDLLHVSLATKSGESHPLEAKVNVWEPTRHSIFQ